MWKLKLQKSEATPSISNQERSWLLFHYCLYAHWKSADNRSILSVIIDRQQPRSSTTAEQKTGFTHRDDSGKGKIGWPNNKMGLQGTTEALNLTTGKLLHAKHQQILSCIIVLRSCTDFMMRSSAGLSPSEMLTHLITVCNLTVPTCSNAAAVLISATFCGQILCSWHIKQDKRVLSQYRCRLSRGSAAQRWSGSCL